MRKTILVSLVYLLITSSLLVPATVFFFDEAYAGTTYYVDVYGDGIGLDGDDNEAGSITAPWATFQKAADTAVAGDTVLFKTGTWTITSRVEFYNDGTNGNLITYRAAPGANPSIDATALSQSPYNGALYFYNADYIVVDGIDIYNNTSTTYLSGGSGIFMKYCDEVLVQNCVIRKIGAAGILMLDGSGIVVNANDISDVMEMGSQEGISIQRSNDIEVKYNRVYDLDPSYEYYSGHWGPKECIDLKVGCYDGSIHHNYTSGGRNNIYVDGFKSDTYDIDIYANECEYFYDAGIKIGAEQNGYAEAVYNINIENNVIHDSVDYQPAEYIYLRNGIILTGDVATYNNINITNNTVYNVAEAAILIDGERASQYYTNISIRNNIFWGASAYYGSCWYSDGPAMYNPSNHTWMNNIFGTIGTRWGCGYFGSADYYILEEPTWVDAGSACDAEDLALQYGSRGVDEGGATNAPSLDYNDNSRPVNLIYDIGAFEYTESAPELPSPLSLFDTVSNINWSAIDTIGPTDTYVIESLFGISGTGAVSQSGWLGSWDHRVKVSIESDRVGSTLTDFPVTLAVNGTTSGIADTDLTFIFDELGEHYKKMAVTPVGSSVQGYIEVERWDTGSENAVMHVLPGTTAKSATDTEFYLYFDSSQSDNSTYVAKTVDGMQSVWDSNYMLVNHMGDSDTSTLPESASGMTGNKLGANEPLQLVGTLSYAQDFDGTDDYVDIVDGGNLLDMGTDDITVEAMVLLVGTPTNAYSSILGGGASSEGRQGWNVWYRKSTTKLGAYYCDDTTRRYPVSGTTSLADDDWHYVAVTFDRSGSLSFYIDTVSQGTYNMSADVAWDLDNEYTFTIGTADGNHEYEWDGNMEEVRVSNTLRSTDWMSATFSSLTDDLVFYGSEETY